MSKAGLNDTGMWMFIAAVVAVTLGLLFWAGGALDAAPSPDRAPQPVTEDAIAYEGNDPANAGNTPAYEECVERAQPKLERCLKGPESGWGACRAAYFSALDGCLS